MLQCGNLHTSLQWLVVYYQILAYGYFISSALIVSLISGNQFIYRITLYGKYSPNCI